MANEVTRLLQQWRQGDDGALDELMPLVYDELRRIAQINLGPQRHHTLQPTALVHEAWLKLFQSAEPAFADRAHLLALMSRVMRQVLVDHARAAGAAKRWGGQQRVPLDATLDVPGDDARPLHVLDLDRALEALGRDNAPLGRIIEMHYFGGMTAEEVAAVVGRSADAVRHDIRLARAYLRRELDRPAPDPR
jgi:RNA polymerase sigma factor (TIGR02999 family)